MWHRAGTITVTKGSKTVTGAGGTAWVQNIRVGDALQGPDGRYYEVTNVASDTALSIEPAYMGNTASGQWYQILPILGQQKRLADRAAELVGAVGLLPGDVEANERRIANAEQAMLTKIGNLSDLQDAPVARENLGLKSAAIRDVGAGADQLPANSNLGAAAYRQVFGDENAGVFAVGALGLGNTNSIPKTWDFGDPGHVNGQNFEFSPSSSNSPIPNAYGLGYTLRNAGNWGTSRWTMHFAFSTGGDAAIRARINNNSWVTWRIWTSANTTVDSNGFVKRASPIIKLYNDTIAITDDLEIKDAEFVRAGVGHYVIRNVPLLSRDGWYIETPKDRNNNIYFTVDYEENIEEKTLTIRTYEPDYSSGRATNGVPVDILDGRFISLRFSEDPSLYPKPEIPEQDMPAA